MLPVEEDINLDDVVMSLRLDLPTNKVLFLFCGCTIICFLSARITEEDSSRKRRYDDAGIFIPY